MSLRFDSANVVVALVLLVVAALVAVAGTRTTGPQQGRTVVRTVLHALCFAAAVSLGRSLMLPETALALFWPAAGVAGLWLLGSQRGVQLQLDVLALLTTAVVVNELLGVSTVVALAFGAANVAVGVAVRAVYRASGGIGPDDRTVGVEGLRHVRDLAVLGAASLAAGLASAPFGVLASYLGSGTLRAEVALSWVLRNTSGVFLVAVVALAVVDAGRRVAAGADLRSLLASRPRPHVVLEAATAVPLSVLLALAVFVPHHAPSLTFVALLGSAYVGSRFAPLVGTLHTTAVLVVALAATLAGTGPFASIDDLLLRADALQVFLLASAAVALTYSMAARQRHDLLARLAAAESRAREQSELLGAVADGLSAGLVVAEESGDVVLANPAARAWVPASGHGASVLRVMEETGSSAASGEPLAPELVPHREALRTGEVVTSEIRWPDPVTGREAVVRVTADPLTLEAGGAAHRLVVVRLEDVTTAHTRQRNLESFAGIVAHDLKGPLAAITSWAGAVGDELEMGLPVGVEAAGTTVELGLERIQSAGAQMNTLIDDLLVFATSGSAELRLAPVALAPLLEDVAGLLRAAVPADAPVPRLHLDTPDLVLADGSLLRQVLANLVGNAVKYVEPGTTPHVTVTSRRLDGEVVELAVEDNGIGIPPEDRQRVFDSFYRAHADRAYRGTGLGLAICAQAVQRHGGTIAAHAGSGGVGTLVVLTLPAA